MSFPATSLRLIFDPPAAGAWNMAVDEALLENAAATGQATLRFYEWNEPTLSLGYFQTHADRRLHPASLECPWVRRASGGGAIVHDRELTYSLVLPLSRNTGTATWCYQLMHETLVESLAALGVEASLSASGQCAAQLQAGSGQAGRLRHKAERLYHNAEPLLCFQRHCDGDVFCRGVKIAGSAQRRSASRSGLRLGTLAASPGEGSAPVPATQSIFTPARSASEGLPAPPSQTALLQHGSVLLSRSPAAPELDGIAELADRTITPQNLAERWAATLARRGLTCQPPAPLPGSMRQAAERFCRDKYENPVWNQRR